MPPLSPIDLKPGEPLAGAPIEQNLQWSLPLTILAVLAVIAAMRLAQEVLIPIVVSVLIVYALDPVVKLFTRIGLGRAAASAVVMLLILSAVGSTAYSLRIQALTVLDEMPEGARRMRALIAANTDSAGPIEKLKKEAALKGATHVLIQSENFAPTPVNTVSISGVAYKK